MNSLTRRRQLALYILSRAVFAIAVIVGALRVRHLLAWGSPVRAAFLASLICFGLFHIIWGDRSIRRWLRSWFY
jgi:hypothetical protein